MIIPATRPEIMEPIIPIFSGRMIKVKIEARTSISTAEKLIPLFNAFNSSF